MRSIIQEFRYTPREVEKSLSVVLERREDMFGATHTRINSQIVGLRSARWGHWAVVLLVYSITGSLSILLSRALLGNILGLDGGLLSGPWSYRIAYLLIVPPAYSVTLVLVGTIFGKHAYFKGRVLRIWGRLLPLGRLQKNRPAS